MALDIFLSLWIGLWFAWSCARQFRAGLPLWGRETSAVLSFVVLILWPITLYFEIAHSPWFWMYALRGAWWLHVVAPLAVLAAVALGYAGGHSLLRSRRDRALRLALVLVGAGFALLLLVRRSGLLVDGDLADFRSGEARSIWSTKLGYLLVVGVVGLGVAAYLVSSRLAAHGKALFPALRDQAEGFKTPSEVEAAPPGVP